MIIILVLQYEVKESCLPSKFRRQNRNFCFPTKKSLENEVKIEFRLEFLQFAPLPVCASSFLDFAHEMLNSVFILAF